MKEFLKRLVISVFVQYGEIIERMYILKMDFDL